MNVHDPREIAKHINSRNAKVLAIFIVIGFIGYHGILHLTSGNYWKKTNKPRVYCILAYFGIQVDRHGSLLRDLYETLKIFVEKKL